MKIFSLLSNLSLADFIYDVFIFKTKLQLKVRLVGEHQVITGSITDLSILAGIYNPMKRSDWIYQVKSFVFILHCVMHAEVLK